MKGTAQGGYMCHAGPKGCKGVQEVLGRLGRVHKGVQRCEGGCGEIPCELGKVCKRRRISRRGYEGKDFDSFF